MDEDWRNAFGILMGAGIRDGAGSGICDGAPSTCSSYYYYYYYYPRAFRRKSGILLYPVIIIPSVRPSVMSHHCS